MNFNDAIDSTKLDNVSFINWLSSQKIIPNINYPRYCSSCGSLMKIEYNYNYSDGAMYRCTSKNCRNRMSIRLDSWISQSKISLKTFIIILACWVNKFNLRTTAEFAGVSEKTSRNYFKIFREIAEKEYRLDILRKPLGDGAVQIDESQFFKAKYNIGTGLSRDEIWLFGEIDSETLRIVVEICDDRKAETLIPIITSTVRPFSTIFSDQWKAYNTLSYYGFNHYTVNHSRNFVEPNTGANTQKIEGTWNIIKQFLDKNGLKDRNNLELYVHEWCFRRNIDNTFDKCWKAIIGN